jgi:Alpha/beta hydrolase of unknown function (DUF900)
MKTAICRALFLIATSALLLGCESARQFRTNYQTGVNPNSTNSNYVVEQTKDYTLGFVEFDDQGWLWNQKQIDTVTAKFSNEMKAQGLLIVTFVHGWKHNADSQDGNVQMMRAVLRDIAVMEQLLSKKENRPARHIAGVYIGWRGLSEKIQPFEDLSFWGRKSTAETVGHGAVVQLLTTLESLKNQSNKNYGDEITSHQRMSTKLIIIGHSFGGDIVYSATAPVLAERMVENVDTNGSSNLPKSLGDMVILINPAFEAARFETIQRLAAQEKFPSGNNCIIAVFTSKTDDATKVAFPLGRRISTLFDIYPKEQKDQRNANVTAVGHYTPYINYDLKPLDTAPKKITQMAMTNEAPVQTSTERIIALKQKRHGVTANTSAEDLTSRFTHTELVPRTNCIANDPVFVVAVDSRIIPDHNTIDRGIFIRFLGEFLFTFSNENP